MSTDTVSGLFLNRFERTQILFHPLRTECNSGAEHPRVTYNGVYLFVCSIQLDKRELAVMTLMLFSPSLLVTGLQTI